MKHTMTTAGEIAVVNLLESLLCDYSDAVKSISAKESKQINNYVFVNVEFELADFTHDINFHVSNIRADNGKYTGLFQVNTGNGNYEIVSDCDANVKTFWITILNQVRA